MSDPFPPAQTRIYLNAPPFFRAIGCGGCGLGCGAVLIGAFVLGGLFGVLLFGWRTLLGY
ncbi:hypothetical protein FHS83_003547 [Rhizomicrobium palustre]|uniref:Uncharacterized protein n=1 Tax=Rhizomicrobium palustre TaxID=189966 RepID=A0A846N3Z4_9PROT|nr:hypothetical protein [Rhizomicrobium palustre]